MCVDPSKDGTAFSVRYDFADESLPTVLGVVERLRVSGAQGEADEFIVGCGCVVFEDRTPLVATTGPGHLLVSQDWGSERAPACP